MLNYMLMNVRYFVDLIFCRNKYINVITIFRVTER